ncbi:MAG: PEP-CTERM sorting domain-containing protein [Myxococcota bacterium]|nr:PEP-CTERM sorting domain-containing protein [Myxococcota bacterium]
MLQKPRWVAVVVASLVIFWATAASATFFTLDDDVEITGGGSLGGVLGFVLRETDFSGSAHGTLTDGTVDFANQDVLVIRLALSAGSALVDAIGIGAAASPILPNPVGAGIFASDTGIAPGAVSVGPFTTLAGLFDYGSGLLAEETSVRMFVAFAPLGALATGNTANFMISSGVDFSVQGTIIPEPATGLLIAGGLLGFGLLARRRA